MYPIHRFSAAIVADLRQAVRTPVRLPCPRCQAERPHATPEQSRTLVYICLHCGQAWREGQSE